MMPMRLAERPAGSPWTKVSFTRKQGTCGRLAPTARVRTPRRTSGSEFNRVFLRFQAGGEGLLEVGDLRSGRLCGCLTLLRLLLRLLRLRLGSGSIGD